METRTGAEASIDIGPADEMISRYLEEREAVIGLLQDIQEHYGYLPKAVLDRISERLGLPRTQLYGLGTFYRAFTLAPQGKHKVCVCTGTACHVRGAMQVLDRIQSDLKLAPGGTTDDGEFSLQTVNCVGACALGPVVIVDGQYEGHMNAAKIRRVLRRIKPKKEDEGDAADSE
ncbi:MAG: NAD(P)H-dependent oxidoreductase subunit E [Planctomycetes bacterium]|nr:NAD(P)H-dependent oxidoreductase subunit E [Planctomycetota bacterium]